MAKYELLLKSKKEIVLDIKNAVEGLKILLEDTSEKLKAETGSQLIKKYISYLNDQIKTVDDFGGYYLVDKEDNKIIEIDFGEKFNSYKIVEINSEYYHLIEVSYTDYNDNECICLYDFNGNLLVESCLSYKFVGKEIKVCQYGYMINSHYDLRDERYWSILGTDIIIGRYSIEYDKDLILYIVDDINCYSEQLDFIGKKGKYLNHITGTHLIIITDDTKHGVWFNGDYLLNPIYDRLRYEEFGNYDVYYSTYNNKQVISIYSMYYNDTLHYQNEFEAKTVELIGVNSKYVLINLIRDDIKFVSYIDILSSLETVFIFNEFYKMEAFYLFQPLFCGVNIELDQTVIFFNATFDFPMGEEEIELNRRYIIFEGVDVHKNVTEFFSSSNRFSTL